MQKADCFHGYGAHCFELLIKFDNWLLSSPLGSTLVNVQISDDINFVHIRSKEDYRKACTQIVVLMTSRTNVCEAKINYAFSNKHYDA